MQPAKRVQAELDTVEGGTGADPLVDQHDGAVAVAVEQLAADGLLAGVARGVRDPAFAVPRPVLIAPQFAFDVQRQAEVESSWSTRRRRLGPAAADQHHGRGRCNQSRRSDGTGQHLLGQLPQNVGHDAAAAVVLHFAGRIDPHLGLEG